MTNRDRTQTAPSPKGPMAYQIRIQGQLGPEWADWFSGLAITIDEDGDTLLTGPVTDQAALHGLLRRVRDLGMPLVSVTPVVPGRGDGPDHTIRHGETMNSDRKAALAAGTLFITADVVGIPSLAILSSILGGPDFLAKAAADPNLVCVGALLVAVMALADAGIAIAMYPVLRRFSPGLAIGSVGFRIIEGALFMIGAIAVGSLLTLSQQSVASGAGDASSYRIAGSLLLAFREQVSVLALLPFGCGALLYCYGFYQSRLLPRWLSGWGVVGAVLTLAAAAAAVLSHRPGTDFMIGLLPLAVNEIVMAVWLLVRGFNSTTVASEGPSVLTATPEGEE
jgi:hypothetical protein